ncbi:MAG: glycosyltransferase [Synechococcaceae bacterium WB8_1B_136]|nr:glycosyltransferase [Synechococcaceae bacterium WB8_1B_136]
MGLYLLHLHLHGLFRGRDLELGRDADTGGQSTYVLELVRSLAARPEVDRVEVVTRQIHDRRVSPDYGEPVESLGPGAAILRFACGPRRYLRKELLWPHLEEMADAITAHISGQSRRPDWIHAHYADAGHVGALVSQRLGIPLVFTGHSLGREKQRRLLADGMAHDQIVQQYAMDRRIEAEELALAQSALVVTSTRQEAEQQYARYDGFRAERARVVPPGVDALRFHPQPLPGEMEAVEELLRPFLRQPMLPPLLAICRAERRKNIPALIEAYGRSALLRQRHNLVLVLGCREDPSQLDKQRRDLFQQVFELVDRFDLYGQVAYPKQHRGEQIPAIYRWAARRGGVFVNPALTEPFGLTLLEAAACGLPLVATDDGGPRDILRCCGNGQLVDVTDLDALQAALEAAAADGERWRRWRDNGIEAVSRHFSWDAHVCSYLGHAQQRCQPQPAALAQEQAAVAWIPPPPPVQRLLVLDLDGCLEAPDGEGLARLRERLTDGAASGLGILSGRSFQAARHRYAELRLREPQVWIVQAGTEIRYGSEGALDTLWQARIGSGWRRDAVEAALVELAPRLQPQPPAQQGDFKVSYLLHPPPEGVLAMVRQKLRIRQLEARPQLVHHWYLDVLPLRASKAEAIRHLALRWQLPLERILVVASQQGEADLLSGHPLGVVLGDHGAIPTGLRSRSKLFVASQPQARGVVEGLDHHRFLRRP